VTIYAYMGHHQAMSLLALDDTLHRDVMRDRFHGDVRVRAIESLLFEGSRPRNCCKTRWRHRPYPPHLCQRRTGRADLEREYRAPRVHLHGNGITR